MLSENNSPNGIAFEGDIYADNLQQQLIRMRSD